MYLSIAWSYYKRSADEKKRKLQNKWFRTSIHRRDKQYVKLSKLNYTDPGKDNTVVNERICELAKDMNIFIIAIWNHYKCDSWCGSIGLITITRCWGASIFIHIYNDKSIYLLNQIENDMANFLANKFYRLTDQKFYRLTDQIFLRLTGYFRWFWQP